MRINQNIMAFNAYRNLSSTNTTMGKSLEKLSSGFRINRAADDAAGLVISQNLRAQVSGLKVATRNAQDGISVVQTAEGALNEVHNLLNRMRDLAVQSANTGSSDTVARNAAAEEVTQAIAEISRIAETTRFGNVKLFAGYQGVFQVGANADPSSQITVAIGTVSVGATGDYALNLEGADVDQYRVTLDPAGINVSAAQGTDTIDITDGTTTESIDLKDFDANTDDFVTADELVAGLRNLGFDASVVNGELRITGPDTTGVSVSNAQGTAVALAGGSNETVNNGLASLVTTGDAAAITRLDDAIASISSLRANLGAYQNRFESTIANLQVTTENLSASESRIRDTDMALEMVSFTRSNILMQAGTAMLAQANQLPQSVLRLLG